MKSSVKYWCQVLVLALAALSPMNFPSTKVNLRHFPIKFTVCTLQGYFGFVERMKIATVQLRSGKKVKSFVI